MKADGLGPPSLAGTELLAVMEPRDDVMCQVRTILDRIGDKWSLAVVGELGPGPRRFTELKQGIPGISQRMLTATLRGLERDGLLVRTVFAVVPPRVDYELTALGRTLLRAVLPLTAWAREHVHDVTESRTQYDSRLPDDEPPARAR